MVLPAEEFVAGHLQVISERVLKQIRKDEEQKKVDDEQVKEHRNNVIVFPTCGADLFRSELVTERYPIFVVNSCKDRFIIREFIEEHPYTGEKISQRMIVGKTSKESSETFGVLQQVHQDLFDNLLKVWGDRGHPLSEDGKHGELVMTAYELVMLARGSDAAHHYRRVRDLIRQLSGIPIVIENGYTPRGVRLEREFTLLGDVEWEFCDFNKETLRPDPGGKSEVTIQFSRRITEGFLKKNVKLLQFLSKEDKKKFSDLALLVYRHLDHELSNKDTYHIKLASLAERFWMARYKYKSRRKQAFVRVIKQLQGMLVVRDGEYELDLKLVGSADGQDYVLEARRVPKKTNALPSPAA